MFPFNRAELLTISTVDRPDLREWFGRSLAELAAARGGHVSDALADWLVENDFEASFTYAIANTDVGEVAKY